MHSFRRTARRGGGRRRTIDLGCERFEDRLLLASYVVANTNDSGAGSLRQAITDADTNFSAPSSNITFNIPGPGPFIISLASELPTISFSQLTIDGTSQPGYAGKPLVEIDGNGLTGDGLYTKTPNCTFKGLDIANFNGAAIHMQGAGNDVATGNFLGTDLTGAAAGPGCTYGVWIDGVNGGIVGGTTAGAANVIGFCRTGLAVGVYISGSGISDEVEGNFIGTDPAGDNLGNSFGVYVAGGTHGIISGNVIGFSGNVGVEINSPTESDTTVQGNFIGTNAVGANLSNAVGVEMDDSTNSTIGGTANGAGNTIALNNTALYLAVGSGNAIQQNLIYGGLEPLLESPGANNLAAPSNLAVASVPGRTTIDYTVNGIVGRAYTVDFFASSIVLGGPAAQFLGTVATPALTSATQRFTATFNIAQPIPSNQFVTATATNPINNTSVFATAVAPSSPFVVTNTNDSVPGGAVGSLRQAILDADTSPGATITFAIPGTGPFVIIPASALPAITAPVTIDGTSQPGYAFGTTTMVELNGNSSISGDGLTLAPGSGGSTIRGLDIVEFAAGAAIHVESDGDTIAGDQLGVTTAGSGGPNQIGVEIDVAAGATIGGTAAGAGNVIGFNPVVGIQIIGSPTGFNTDALIEGNAIGTDSTGSSSWGNGTAVQIFQAAGNTVGGTAAGAANVIGRNPGAGVAILSGYQNVVAANSYFGTNGSVTKPSVAVGDIGLGPGANNSLQPPALTAASLSSDGTTLELALASPAPTAAVLDVYFFGPGGRRVFLGETTLAAGASSTSLVVTGLGVTSSSQIVATQTVAADGTSAFSAPQASASQSTVTNANSSGPGSLANAVAAANSGGSSDITFQILGNGPFTISLTSPLSITVPITIDGTSELGFGGAPAIVLSGAGAAVGIDLGPTSGGSTIDGLQFTGFTQADILVESSGNTIGAVNVLSTAGSSGVVITGSNNVLEGNFIGTDAAGHNLGGGRYPGVVISGGVNNSIGGKTAGAGNTIGFSSVGVSITGSAAAQNILRGNFIGTDAAGHDLGNQLGGVVIGGASNNKVGGTGAGASNTIAFNAGPAVTVQTGVANVIRANLIYGNGSSTIPSGIVLANGGNDNAPAPQIAGALSLQSSIVVTLQTAMAVGTILDFFASTGPVKAIGPIQAQVFLGTQTVNQSGQVSFTLGSTSLSSNQYIIATATSPNNDTSGFSNAVAVTLPSASAASVTSTADDGSAGTLRAAINAANKDVSPIPDVITFSIPGSGPFVINLTSPITITHPVILDAATQPGYLSTPIIVLDGRGVVSMALILNAPGGSTIEGLNIVKFTGPAIDIESDGNTIVDNEISAARVGNGIGVLVNGSNNTIGGTVAGAGNTIANNVGIPVDVRSGAGDAIRGNLIYANGPASSPGLGITLEPGANNQEAAPGIFTATSDSSGTTITGTVSGSVTGLSSGTYFLDFYSSASRMGPAQNYLGSIPVTIADGATAPFTFTYPQYLSGSLAISATATGPDNSTSMFSRSVQVTVENNNTNLIVTTISGGADVSGSLAAVIAYANGHPSSDPHAPDLITFNIKPSETNVQTNGIYVIALDSSEAIAVPVTLDATTEGPGTYQGTPLVEVLGGGLILQPASNGVLGSNGSIIEGLDIVNPGGAGIVVESSNDQIIDDVLGVDLSGGAANRSREAVGVSIAAVAGAGANGTVTAGTVVGTTVSGNVIGNNMSAGVSIAGSTVTDNTVAGNAIGTDTAGATEYGNGEGIVIDGGASGNTIGGSSAAAANVIEFNGTGISISGAGTSGNVVAENLIGTNSAGATTTGNSIGIVIADGASGNRIGGAGAGNTIGGNTSAGVSIGGTATAGNVVAGNLIGVASGGSNLGNGAGVVIDGASDSTIGGTAAGAANTIADNNGPAVHILSGSGNSILEDLIYGDALAIVVDPGANGGQAAPAVLAATSNANLAYQETIDDTVTTVAGAGNQDYRVEFFAGGVVGGPAARFLGSYTTSLAPSTTQRITATFSLAAKLLADEAVTATLTGPDGTSEFALVAVAPVSPFVVTNSTDAQQGSEVGSLRLAMFDANLDPGTPITFDGRTGPFDISPVSELPAIAVQMEIDGINPNGSAGAPFVTIDGKGQAFDGLTLTASSAGSKIEGLEIVGFGGDGILVLTANNTIGGAAAGAGNVISGNHQYGVQIESSGNLVEQDVIESNGATASSVPYDGIDIHGSSNVILGNVISANLGDGVLLEASATLNTVRGNFIGTDPAGASYLPNQGDGIEIQGSGNLFSANVISGNQGNGVLIIGSGATGNRLVGNAIGTDLARRHAVGNGNDGIDIQAPNNTIGGPSAGDGNLISGNVFDGILIETMSTLVENNTIGTDLAGTVAVPNQRNGVEISGPPNTLGGTAAGGGDVISANTISGNAGSGIVLDGNAANEVIQGNRIGIDASGRKALANANGVVLIGVGGNSIGGASPGDANVISGNSGVGIGISGGGSRGNLVVGNGIGTDASGESAVGNDTGISISGSTDNTIGGLAAADANVISGNASIAIQIVVSTSTGNLVVGNRLGTNLEGSSALSTPNRTTGLPIGILISDSPANTIGGTVSGAGNVISGFGVGIDISGFNALGNAIEGDLIGTDRNGNRLAGSIDIGVYINNVASNTVGGSTAGAGNVIAGYSSYGVFIYGTLAKNNVIQGNRIGTGTPSHSGELAGIAIEDASDNMLGGSTASTGNTIAGNADAGIYIFGQRNSASGNVSSQNHLEHNGYGVLLYNAANNGGYATLLHRNRFKANGIANVREFTGSVPSSNVLSHPARSKGHKASQHTAIHRTRLHHLHTRLDSHHAQVLPTDREFRKATVEERGPVSTNESTLARLRRRTHPDAVPRGPMAHLTSDGRRLNRPPSAGGHAGRATGRTAS